MTAALFRCSSIVPAHSRPAPIRPIVPQVDDALALEQREVRSELLAQRRVFFVTVGDEYLDGQAAMAFSAAQQIRPTEN